MRESYYGVTSEEILVVRSNVEMANELKMKAYINMIDPRPMAMNTLHELAQNFSYKLNEKRKVEKRSMKLGKSVFSKTTRLRHELELAVDGRQEESVKTNVADPSDIINEIDEKVVPDHDHAAPELMKSEEAEEKPNAKLSDASCFFSGKRKKEEEEIEEPVKKIKNEEDEQEE